MADLWCKSDHGPDLEPSDLQWPKDPGSTPEGAEIKGWYRKRKKAGRRTETKVDLTSRRLESITPPSWAVAVLGSMAQVKRRPLLHVVEQQETRRVEDGWCVSEILLPAFDVINLQVLRCDMQVKRRLPSLNPGRVQMRSMQEVKLSFRPGGVVDSSVTSINPNHRALIYKWSIRRSCHVSAEAPHRLHAPRSGSKVPRRRVCRTYGRQLRHLSQGLDAVKKRPRITWNDT